MTVDVDECIRCEDLFFDGGNIVIRAGDVLFRVYTGVLANASPVFKDMFIVSHGANAELYQGVPLLNLPDSVPDTTVFLKSLNYLGYAEERIEADICALASVLRMGTKYEVSHLRKIAVARLRYMYPSDLDGLHSRFIDFVKDISANSPITIAAISLARTCNVPSIMPLCFLLNVWATASKTLARRALRIGGSYTAEDGTVYTVLPEDSDICLSGAWKLAERRRRVFSDAFSERSACRNGGCARDRFHSLSALPPPNTSSPHALYIFDDLFIRRFPLCRQCESELDPVWQEAISAEWQALPSCFDLPPWEELLAIK